MKLSHKPRLTIGLPVYNGERFVARIRTSSCAASTSLTGLSHRSGPSLESRVMPRSPVGLAQRP
jgi:hypothetical protein